MARFRDLERQYMADPGDSYAHAKMLRLLLAGGKIKPVNIELAAFLGHPACRLLIKDEKVKPDGVIRYDKLVKNIEIQHFIWNLHTWGFLIVYLAGAALIKLAAEEFKKPLPKNTQWQSRKRNESTLTLAAHLINEFVRSPTPNKRNDLLNLQRNNRNQSAYLGNDKLWRIYSSFRGMLLKICGAKNCVQYVSGMSIHFDDEIVKEAIRKEIYPFILGEYA